MSDAALSTEPRPAFWRRNVRHLIGAVVTALIIGTALGPAGIARVLQLAGDARLHAPRFDLIAPMPLAIKIHLATVAAAFVLGWVLMSGLKGTRLHRTLGWGWAALMGTTAVASLFIHQPGQGFSVLHLFAAITLASLPLGVAAARKHKVEMHRRSMTGLFFGGLIVAGAAAFMPGRLMWRVFFG
jgi:uncharacterized membrane protein